MLPRSKLLALATALCAVAANTTTLAADDKVDAAKALAACTASTGNPGTTVERCSDAIDNADLDEAQRAVALTRRGLARFSEQQLAKAAEDLDAATQADPKSYSAWNGRGIVAMQAGETERAISAFDAALQAKPDFASALANRGNAWLARGELDKAQADLERAVALKPARLELALTLRGRTLAARGDFEGALRDYEAALAANGKYSNALDGRAWARFALGQHAQAADDFTREWQQRPEVETAAMRVIALRRAGQPARKELEEASKGAGTAQGAAPVLALLAGQMKPEQVLEATRDKDANTQRLRRCTAEFQVGEWQLLQKQPAKARARFEAARSTCTPAQPEWAAARAELENLPAK